MQGRKLSDGPIDEGVSLRLDYREELVVFRGRLEPTMVDEIWSGGIFPRHQLRISRRAPGGHRACSCCGPQRCLPVAEAHKPAASSFISIRPTGTSSAPAADLERVAPTYHRLM